MTAGATAEFIRGAFARDFRSVVSGVEGCCGRGVRRHAPLRVTVLRVQAAGDAAEEIGFGAGRAKAMRTREGVSVMRAAILSSRCV